ncbi:MAG: lantibiotic dehydratase [Pseudonocardiaceae bacterium]
MADSLYRCAVPAILRAAITPAPSDPLVWPDLAEGSPEELRRWLVEAWEKPGVAEAVRVASPSLAEGIEAVCSGQRVEQKQVRRRAASLVRYMLRATGRATPFGLFAGTAAACFADDVKVRWGSSHHQRASADAVWLDDILTRLEAIPRLLERLRVQVSNLHWTRGGWVVLPGAGTRVEVRHTPPVRVALRIAASPVRFAALAEAVGGEFPEAPPSVVGGMLADLVRHGVLVSCLRPPATAIDPLGYVISRLDTVGAEEVVEAETLVFALRTTGGVLDRCSHATPEQQAEERAAAITAMAGLSTATTTPVALDVRLDCDVQIPHCVAAEMEAAASALLRLSPYPGGHPVWRDYYERFVHHYGEGTIVPLLEVVDADMGLGLPATYPGSLLPPPEGHGHPSERDRRLLALVQQADIDGRTEIVLDHEEIARLAVADITDPSVPPHIELAARIHAPSVHALADGDFTLTVFPARSAGTMTGRFTTRGSAMAEVYRDLPVATAGTVAAQLSFPPMHADAANVSRTPQFLPHVIALGEYCPSGHQEGLIPLGDLALVADWHRLHLVEVSRTRTVEPHLFHALALEQQAPPLARFLAQLPRASCGVYHRFDWGVAADLPRLPRVRYRRSVLCPAQWRIQSADLPATGTDWPSWSGALKGWQTRWSMPNRVELHDGDQALPLDLTETAHAATLRTHLDRNGHAVVTEIPEPSEDGWLQGHAHELVVPLVSRRPPAPSPLAKGRHVVAAPDGQLPASPSAEWVYCKVFAHPERHDEIIAHHLPRLLEEMEGRPWWFMRYRSPHESDHLRLRFRVADPGAYGAVAARIGAWTGGLRKMRLAHRLVFDTYLPEVGRYGDGPRLAAAEAVFVADSAAVLTQLRRASAVASLALCAANMVDIAAGFAGSTEQATAWLIGHPAKAPARPAARSALAEACELADPAGEFAALRALPAGGSVVVAWQVRRAVLAAYRSQFPSETDIDPILDSLLHLHHIRAIGVDRGSERTCRRAARMAALSWRARTGRH